MKKLFLVVLALPIFALAEDVFLKCMPIKNYLIFNDGLTFHIQPDKELVYSRFEWNKYTSKNRLIVWQEITNYEDNSLNTTEYILDRFNLKLEIITKYEDVIDGWYKFDCKKLKPEF